MKKPLTIAAAAVAVYIIALLVAWHHCSVKAERNTIKMLEQFESTYTESVCDSIDGVLLHAALAIQDQLGNTARPVSIEEMRELADVFHVDEINIVNSNGFCIASSVEDIIGKDFTANPLTAKFLVVTNNTPLFVSQPFRLGITNPGNYRKYLGTRFLDKSGVIQLGFDYERLIRSLDIYNASMLLAWKVGLTGNLALYDADGDGHCDYSSTELQDGKTASFGLGDSAIYLRSFSFAGHRYITILPAREYFDQRNTIFAIIAPTLAIVVVFLAFLVRYIAHASEMENKRRMTLDAARERDLELAQTIQKSALPSPDIYNREYLTFTFAAASWPAREVGGDFYDFTYLGGANMAFVIADVSGKGVPAAMFMMETKYELFNALRANNDPVEAVRIANIAISGHNDAKMFVTAWVGIIDTSTGEMEYVNAGHCRPYIRRANGEVEKVAGKGGLIIGLFPDAKYHSERLRLAPGDRLFLYTDGVTEAMNPSRELYGQARLAKILADSSGSIRDTIADVEADISVFSDGAEKSDDITALALIWHGKPERHEADFASDPSSLTPALDFIRGCIGLKDRKAKARLLNAADETMANIVSYSKSGTFTVIVENAPKRTRLTLVDDGIEYNPLLASVPELHTSIEERKIGGLGILITRTLVDSIGYRREVGKNILTLLKAEA